MKQYMFHFLSIIFICIFTNVFLARPYTGNFNAVLDQIEDPENTSFYITKISFVSDIFCDQKELLYLVGLKQDSFISKRDVDRAWRCLMSKKRFSLVSVDMEDYESGKHLIFSMTSHWIFKRLIIAGVWFGKPMYSTSYIQQPGEIFDAALHAESIALIQKKLYSQGYFQCSVTDELIYSKSFKTITACIKIKKKRRFLVQSVNVHIQDMKQQYEFKKNDDIDEVIAQITTKLRSEIVMGYYSKQHVVEHFKECKNLLIAHGFPWARITLKKMIHTTKPWVDLIFLITLGKRKIITVAGNTAFSEEYINHEIMSSDLPDWIYSPDILAQQLLHEYTKKGFWHARVKSNTIGDVGFHFDIKEGLPVIIENVEVIDTNTRIPEKSIAFFNNLLVNKQADELVLDGALEKLKQHYITNGFWDFSIIDKSFTKNHATGCYILTILIDKGAQRLWGGFSIKGFPEIEANNFFQKYKHITKQQSIPFNLQWVHEQRLFLLNIFQKLGHWYTVVEPEFLVIKNKQNNQNPASKITMFVAWKIEQGSQVKFGKAVLRGATRVPFHRIKKQFMFDFDEPWSREKIDLTRKKLKQLDVFKVVQVQPYQLSKNKSKKPVIITLVDDEPIELRARVGYFLTSKNFIFKQQSTPKIGSSFIIKNPMNCADRILLEGDWTKFERRLSMDYYQPSPFGIGAMSTIKSYSNKYIHPVEIAQSESAYEALQQGFSIGLNDEYKRDYHWSFNLGNEWLKTSRVRGNLNLDKKFIDTTLPYLFFEPGIIIDKIDNHVNTTKGSRTAMSLKMMFPENDGEVTAKLIAEQSLFYPIYKKIILAGHIRFGHIFKRRFDHIMPVERFYLGGPFSVRGYEPDAVPPFGVSENIVNGAIIKNFTIQGGSSMINTNLELRFSLYKSFGAVLFYDLGILSQSGFLGFKSRWYPGSGFGLRYKSPIGSIRFDIGWKWKRRLEGDTRNYAWYLTLGEAF